MAERGAVRVVDDQVGTPTSATSLARALWAFATHAELSGLFHWSDAGVASWYDFAVAIGEEAASLGLLRAEPSVAPIATTQHPTPARRPAYSVLDKHSTIQAVGMTPPHWRVSLRAVLKEMSNG